MIEMNALEQQDKSSDKTGNASACEGDREEQYGACRGQVEQHKSEHELPEVCYSRDQPNEPVDDGAVEHWRHNSEWKDVEKYLQAALDVTTD